MGCMIRAENDNGAVYLHVPTMAVVESGPALGFTSVGKCHDGIAVSASGSEAVTAHMASICHRPREIFI